MNPIPTSYTYGGITVDFNDVQKALLAEDLALINKLNLDIIEWDRQIAVHLGTANHWDARLNSYCPTLNKYQDRVDCSEEAVSKRDQAYADRASVINAKSLTLEQLQRAKQKLNDDLLVIQNQIKLQIQTQIANTTANTQGASNTVAINQSNPLVLTANIKRQQELDKLKQEQTVKIVLFVLGAAVIITLGIFGIKRALA